MEKGTKNVLIVVFVVLATFIFFGVLIAGSSSNNAVDSSEDYYVPKSTSPTPTNTPVTTPSYKTPTYTAPTYKGYTCTDDCSGHEAGYEWAEEHGITQDDVDGYSGNSDSFQEGMQSYVDENE